MLLGLSLAQFTTLHVAISLVAIASGLAVLLSWMRGKETGSMTQLFLITTVLTSVTGFMFPFHEVTPGIVVGAISIVVLIVAILARYTFHLTGPWRKIYVITASIALYLNVFVLVAQSFQKIPALRALAPTQSEAPFVIVQLLVMALFVVLGWNATTKFAGTSVSALWRKRVA